VNVSMESMVDLRSDTVTHPTEEMRRAMMDAMVGDDQYGEDPTVNELERQAAALLGKEAAVYVASGTMGNLSALLAHCGRGDEAIVGSESHILWYEMGGISTLGGIPIFTVANDAGGRLAPMDVANAIREPRAGYPRTGVVCLENTQNRCGGAVLTVEDMRGVRMVAHDRGVPVHLDGARIFNAAAALGVSAEALATEVDSVQFCLSKGLGCPVGSVVAGTEEFVHKVRSQRKVLGGAMRQAGVIAAAGLVAFETMIQRLPEDHQRAKRLATGLAAIDGVEIDLNRVQSNIIVFKVAGVDHAAFIESLKAEGLLVSNYGLRGVRMVTHYQITDADIDFAVNTVAGVLAGQVVAHA
jgi:threonine aldolase